MQLDCEEACVEAAPVDSAASTEEETPLLGLVALVRHELAFHGLDWTVREEIEQEIAVWLVRKWPSLELPVFPAALASALVRQFLRPGNVRRWQVEERIVPEAARPHSSLRCDSAAADRLTAAEWLRALEPKDRQLATRLLSGENWIEACEKEDVPAGSRAFRRARIKGILIGARECAEWNRCSGPRGPSLSI